MQMKNKTILTCLKVKCDEIIINYGVVRKKAMIIVKQKNWMR